jgi:hypothetical protein
MEYILASLRMKSVKVHVGFFPKTACGNLYHRLYVSAAAAVLRYSANTRACIVKGRRLLPSRIAVLPSFGFADGLFVTNGTD